MRSKLLCAFLCFFFCAAQGQNIEWDKGFGNGGFIELMPKEKGNADYETAQSALKLSDGKTLAAIYHSAYSAGVYLQRHLADGTLDPAYERAGTSVAYPVSKAKLVRLTDGKILLIGEDYDYNSSLHIYRLMPDGTLDRSFNQNLPVKIPVENLWEKRVRYAAWKDGKIMLLVASKPGLNATYKPALICLHADGSLDSAFGNNGVAQLSLPASAIPFGITVSSTRIIVGFVDNGKIALAAYNEQAVPALQFGSAGNGVFYPGIPSHFDEASLASLPDGRILIGASVYDNFINKLNYNVYRLNADGSQDKTFDADGAASVPQSNNRFWSAALLTDAAGNAWYIGYSGFYGSYAVTTTRFTNDGALDKTFGVAGQTTIPFTSNYIELNDAQLALDGTLTLAGSLSDNSINDFFINKINRYGQPESSFGDNGMLIGFVPAARGNLWGLRPFANGAVYARYDGRGAIHEKGVVRIKANGKPDSAYGKNGIATTAAPYFDTLSGGRLIAAETVYNSAYGDNLLELTRFLANGERDGSFGPDGMKKVGLLPAFWLWQIKTLPDNKLLVYGQYRDGNNEWYMSIIRLNVDGSVDATFGVNGYVNFKDHQYLDIKDLVVLKDGRILIGGSLNSTNGKMTFAMCRLMPNGYFDDSFGDKGFVIENNGTSAYIEKLLPQPDGYFLVSYAREVLFQNYSSYQGMLGRFDQNGKRQTAFGTDGETGAAGSYHYVQNDGRLLAIGHISFDDLRMLHISMLLANGRVDRSFGVDGVVYLQLPHRQLYFRESVQSGNRIILYSDLQGEFETKAILGALSVTENNLLVSSFTLLNATSDKDIRTLEDNAVINLAEIKGKSINIRANTKGEIGSLTMQLSGAQTHTQTENIVPYALFGNTGSNYKHWRPKSGNYTLQAIPYAQAKATGTAGPAHTVSFKIIDSLTLSGLTLINAKTNQPIGPLADGAVIDLAQTPYINIRANTGVGITESVRFGVNENRSYAVESILPFALAADNKGRFYPWQVAPGTYTITATPYSQNSAAGKPGHPVSVTIQVIRSGMQAPAVAQKAAAAPAISRHTGIWLGAYPNPAQSDTYIRYRVATTTNVAISLVDQKGTAVRQVYRGSAAGGVEHRITLPLTQLPAGIYFIKLTTADGTTQTHKLIKQ